MEDDSVDQDAAAAELHESGDEEQDSPPHIDDEDEDERFNDFQFVLQSEQSSEKKAEFRIMEDDIEPANVEEILAEYVSEASNAGSAKQKPKRVTQQERITMIHERSTVNEVDGDVLQKQYGVDKLRNQLKESNEKLRKLEYEVQICQSELNDAEKKKENVTADRLRDKLRRIDDETNAENALHDRIQAHLDAAEYALCESLVHQGHYALMGDELQRNEAIYARQQRQDAFERKRKELKSTHQAMKDVLSERREADMREMRKIAAAEQQREEAIEARRTVNQFINRTITE